jgi:hypothetical protein
MKRRLLPLICALVFVLFHVLTVVSTLVSTHGAGEGQGFLVALLDFPLFLLLQAVPGGGYILYGSTVAYVWFFSIAGTLFYATIGYFVGIVLRMLMARMTSANEKRGAI